MNPHTFTLRGFLHGLLKVFVILMGLSGGGLVIIAIIIPFREPTFPVEGLLVKKAVLVPFALLIGSLQMWSAYSWLQHERRSPDVVTAGRVRALWFVGISYVFGMLASLATSVFFK